MRARVILILSFLPIWLIFQFEFWIAIVFSLALFELNRRHRNDDSLIAGMNKDYFREFMLTGMQPEEIVNGLWGADASRRAQKINLLASIILTLVFMAAAFILHDYDPQKFSMGTVTICTALSAICLFSVSYLWWDPFIHFSDILDRLKSIRDKFKIERKRVTNPAISLQKIVKAIGLIVSVFLALSLLTNVISKSGILERQDSLLKWLWIPLCLLLGYGFGHIIGAHCKRSCIVVEYDYAVTLVREIMAMSREE